MAVCAAPVDTAVTCQVARCFLEAQSAGRSLSGEGPLECVYSVSAPVVGGCALRVYSTDRRFVVVSADNSVEPVLGYSTEGAFNPQDIPAGLREMLQSYAEEIGAVVGSQVDATPLQGKWQSLAEGSYRPHRSGSRGVSALLSNNNWQQNNGYNYYCPADPNGPAGHAYVGCVALAMGQVIHYWQYPTRGIGTHSYLCNHSSSQAGNYGDYGTLSANFGATTYNYAMMPNYLTSSTPSNQILPISTLLYHCGVAVDMYYGPDGSMAFHSDIADALETYFDYPECQTCYKSHYTDDAWNILLKNDLDLQRPIIYCAYASQGGHEFVCDGYNDQNYFHFNWGWGGSSNGYFLISNMNPGSYVFSNSHGVVLGIHPKDADTVDIDTTVCGGLGIDDVAYGQSGLYTLYSQSVNGYPVITNLHLTVYPEYIFTEEVTVTSVPYVWHGQSLTTSGTYYDHLYTEHGCDSIYQLFLTVQVGVQDADEGVLSVYPNPTTGLVRIKNEELRMKNLEVYDAYGKLLNEMIVNDRTVNVDLGDYAKGVYFVRVTTEKGVVTKRVVKF